MRFPPPGCWACGKVPSKEDIALRSVLQPREAGEGGPWVRLACEECGTEGALEDALGAGPVLAPLETVGFGVPVVATLLDGRRGRDFRRRSREWVERYGPGLERLREERRRGRGPGKAPPPAPPPPSQSRGRNRRGDAEGASPPPPRAVAGLPSTPEEARRLLGVPPRATRREIDAAFRKASRKCHPDLVAHLDEDFQRLAHEKFLRIKRAHEILTR